MGKGYGLFYAWELLPSLAVMGIFLSTVPMGTYAAWRAIMGQPKKVAMKGLEYEAELRSHEYGVKKRYYGHSRTAASSAQAQ